MPDRMGLLWELKPGSSGKMGLFTRRTRQSLSLSHLQCTIDSPHVVWCQITSWLLVSTLQVSLSSSDFWPGSSCSSKEWSHIRPHLSLKSTFSIFVFSIKAGLFWQFKVQLFYRKCPMSKESTTKSIVQLEGSSQSQYPSVLNNSTLGTKVGIHHSRTSFFSNSAVKKIWGSYLTRCRLGPAMLLCTPEQSVHRT